METDNDAEATPNDDLSWDEIPEAVEIAPPIKPPPNTRPSKLVRAIVLVVIMIGLPLVTFLAISFSSYNASMESLGTAEVQFEILPRNPPLILDGQNVRGVASAPVDLETELAWIRSEEVLTTVVIEQDLVRELNLPSTEAAVEWLKRSSDVRHIGGNVVGITVRSGGDPLLAAKLANRRAIAYKQRREMVERERAKRVLEELQLEAKGQEKLMEDARVTMLNLLKETGVIDLAAWDDPQIETPLMRSARRGAGELSEEQIAKLAKQSRMLTVLELAKSEYITYRKLLDSLTKAIGNRSIAEKMPREAIHVLKQASVNPHPTAVMATPPASFGKWLIWGLLASVVAAAGICTLLILWWDLRTIRAAERV